MFCWNTILGGVLSMMGQHSRSEALFHYFRLTFPWQEWIAGGARKRKEHRIVRSDAPGFVPSPRYFANQLNYCSTVKAWQAAVVVTGVLPAAPALNRSTPSSLEQKLRTPDWLKVTGEAPAV